MIPPKTGMGPFFNGGPHKNVEKMIAAAAAFRDEGGLPSEATLMFTQLLLNMVGHAGRAKADELLGAFLDAADVRR